MPVLCPIRGFPQIKGEESNCEKEKRYGWTQADFPFLTGMCAKTHAVSRAHFSKALSMDQRRCKDTMTPILELSYAFVNPVSGQGI